MLILTKCIILLTRKRLIWDVHWKVLSHAVLKRSINGLMYGSFVEANVREIIPRDFSLSMFVFDLPVY